MYLIDVAGHNSVIMHKYLANQTINTSSIYFRRKCLEKLAIDLMKHYVEERSKKIILNTWTKAVVQIVIDNSPSDENCLTRCETCLREHDRKTRHKRSRCTVFTR
ncbi:unnamed protein product [Brachionus calyciflorus]|uniref:Uncharacterized protein n=1 Tax=Brachionus calyciflorus TaxID=104777 RepID=A0A814CDI6_9BILA|nr:unnamed protein product [Brachionus calyciflorus]